MTVDEPEKPSIFLLSLFPPSLCLATRARGHCAKDGLYFVFRNVDIDRMECLIDRVEEQ